ncbi:amidohydrolase family protein [Pendulispora albinea]|uniref:Amidohydrolase family protein n=1 Tax=Pendulispora albinea TaxID=2741071 RepID=A0ABZ2M432_9BACT
MTERLLLRGGTIVGVDAGAPDVPHADLLIENGSIAHIGHGVAVAPDTEVIDASSMLVLPGLIDTHRHTWQTALRHRGACWSLGEYFNALFLDVGPRIRPEDVYASTSFAALAALDSGITTLLDWSHVQNSPAHADAAIDALTEAGLRAVFGHGRPRTKPGPGIDPQTQPHPADLRRIRRERLSSDDALVTLAMAADGPDFSARDVAAADFTTARELGLRITTHVAAGDPSSDNRSIEWMHAAGLLGSDLTLVHAAAATDEALRLLADRGVTVSVSPQIELVMEGLGTPIVGRMLAAGITPSLSVDAETSASSDMFTQMRMAYAAYRALPAGGVSVPTVTARDVLGWATIEGARATGLNRRTGSLAVGKDADIVLVRATDSNLFPVSTPANAVVTAAHPGNVDTVLVKGRVRKRGGRLLADLDGARRRLAASQAFLLGEEGDARRSRAVGRAVRGTAGWRVGRMENGYNG